MLLLCSLCWLPCTRGVVGWWVGGVESRAQSADNETDFWAYFTRVNNITNSGEIIIINTWSNTCWLRRTQTCSAARSTAACCYAKVLQMSSLHSPETRSNQTHYWEELLVFFVCIQDYTTTTGGWMDGFPWNLLERGGKSQRRMYLCIQNFFVCLFLTFLPV